MDDDLDFSTPAMPTPKLVAPPVPVVTPATPAAPAAPRAAAAAPLLYDPQLALRFFRFAGQEETFAAGAQIFAEEHKAGGFFAKGARVYLLLEGEVALTVKGQPLNLMLPGETFGELAVISDAPRSATAIARKACRVLSLDEKRFLASLQQAPEFALMLIGIMSQRLQRSIEKLLATTSASLLPRSGLRGLSKSDVADLRHALGDPTPTPMKAGDAIVTKGAVGAMMFVLLAGQVSTAVDGRVVEHLGPGGIFGETAMLGAIARSASVTADTDGFWLPISRRDFLAVVQSRPAIGVGLLRSMSERILATTALIRHYGGGPA